MQNPKAKKLDDNDKRFKRVDVVRETYPMCMTYYKPLNLVIFALVSREIVIKEVKQSGQRKIFMTRAWIKIDDMPIHIDVG